jgi:hypothetical protein
MERGIRESTTKWPKCRIVVDSKRIKSRMSQIELLGHTIQYEISSCNGEGGGSRKVTRGIPPHVAAQILEALPFHVGFTHVEFDAQSFHKQLGLYYCRLLVEEIFTK